MSEIDYAIDFGTSTTLLAIPQASGARVIQIEPESPFSWLPSVIAKNENSEWIVGSNALYSPVNSRILSPKSAITNGCKTLKNAQGDEISADLAITLILGKVIQSLKENNLDPNGRVRMSCPAMWDGDQRLRLVNIAQKLGINTNIDDLMDEPIAAGINWWWNKTLAQGKKIDSSKIVVFDLGGGTLDVAVIYINYIESSPPEITVMGARGVDIAGDAIDKAFTAYLLDRLKSEEQFDYSAHAKSADVYGLVLRAARELKELLSDVTSGVLSAGVEGIEIPRIEVYRNEFEEHVLKPFLPAFRQEVELVLRETRLKKDNITPREVKALDISEISDQIDYLVLAGGMSQIPKIAQEIQSMFSSKTILDYATLEKSNSALGIVEGLASRNESLNLNVHRPNFSFIVEYTDKYGTKHSDPIYRAFTPIYTAADIRKEKDKLAFGPIEYTPKVDPKDLHINITLQTLGGRRLSFFDRLLKREAKHLRFRADSKAGIKFTLYVEGKFIIYDALGKILDARVRQWPMIRWGENVTQNASIELETDNTFHGHYVWEGMDDWRHN